MNDGDRTFIGTRDDRLDRLRGRNSQRRVVVRVETPEDGWALRTPPDEACPKCGAAFRKHWRSDLIACLRGLGAVNDTLMADGPVSDDTPAPTAQWTAWARPQDLVPRLVTDTRSESHRTIQVRVDRHDDYFTVPLYAGRAGSTPDLTALADAYRQYHTEKNPTRWAARQSAVMAAVAALFRSARPVGDDAPAPTDECSPVCGLEPDHEGTCVETDPVTGGPVAGWVDALNRAGATPDLTALLPSAHEVEDYVRAQGLNPDLGDIVVYLAAVAALVRSAQNDTDHG